MLLDVVTVAVTVSDTVTAKVMVIRVFCEKFGWVGFPVV